MKLKELQRQFANHIYNPRQNKILDEISLSKINPEDRLQTYRNNVFGNFDSVLEITYPIVQKIVGQKEFYNLCALYHQKYSSKSGNLDEYGKYFADILKAHKIPYLKAIAKLEWHYHCAYFSGDVKEFALEKFQKLEEKNLFKVKFKLHPSCVLLQSKYPIYSIYKSSGKKTKILEKEFILIERANFITNVSKLLEIEFWFLKNAKNKMTLYDNYQDLEKRFKNCDIGKLMNKFISNGVIAQYLV
jgi:hypothetical protein